MRTPDAPHTEHSILLAEHETTGLLPVGFEFERHGARYDHFDLSADGFITFSRGSRRGAGVADCVGLVQDRTMVGGGRVTYGTLSSAPRRRLVVFVSETSSPGSTLQVTVHERTGIVEVGGEAQSFGVPTIRQLARVHSSPSRANSTRKIG